MPELPQTKVDNSELDLIIKSVTEFEELAVSTDRLFRETFSIEESPILAASSGVIPRRGVLQSEDVKVVYRFHGNGCKFMFGEIVVDINYDTTQWKYNGVDQYALIDFIESKGGGSLNRLEVLKALKSLNSIGRLYKPDERYDRYQVA